MSDLAALFGHIDIYLFDQLLRGRIGVNDSILDVGCGGGRNLAYLLRAGYAVFGTDENAEAIASLRRMAEALAPNLPKDNFRVEAAEAMSFPEKFADVVLCNAVLHFARDDAHFNAMLNGAWRALKPGGMFFARLASSIGMESMADRLRPISGRRCFLPDGSQRYLVDEALLMEATQRLGGELLDPLKTTVVQDQRCMTTWVVRKK